MAGRPKKPKRLTLDYALDYAHHKHRKHFLEHVIDRAYKNDLVAIAVLRKILPDKILDESQKASNLIYVINKYLGLKSGTSERSPSEPPEEPDRIRDGSVGNKPLEG